MDEPAYIEVPSSVMRAEVGIIGKANSSFYLVSCVAVEENLTAVKIGVRGMQDLHRFCLGKTLSTRSKKIWCPEYPGYASQRLKIPSVG